MAKIIVECNNPNDLNALEKAVEEAAGKCNVTYFKQAQALQESGVAKSEREAARKIAEETGESDQSVRRRIQKGKNKMAQVGPKKESETISNTSGKLENLEKNEIFINKSAFDRVNNEALDTKTKKSHGGARKGAGRKPQEEVCVEFKQGRLVATFVIHHLGRIEECDPERQEAFDMVVDWISENR